jgi:hypothetical protein
MIFSLIKCYQYCKNNKLEFKGGIIKKQKSDAMNYHHKSTINNIQKILKFLNFPNNANIDKHNLIHENKFIHEKINSSICKELYELAKKNFYNIKKNNEFIVCIHIRRGDVSEDGRWKKRFTPDEVYLKFINKILELKPDAKIYIFSIKENFINTKYFKEYKKLNCIFKLVSIKKRLNDDSFIEVFNYFVMSDIFLIASSSFSIVPALFKKNGLVVYPDNLCFFDPFEYWININNNKLYEKVKLM